MAARQSSEYCNEDEIDLRKLFFTLWGGKWVILLSTLVAVLAALSISFAMPKQYQAQALIGLTQPNLEGVVREGMSLRLPLPDLTAAAAIAQSPAIFQRLLKDAEIQAAWRQAKPSPTWQTLAAAAEVQVQGESGLQLRFKDTDARRATLVVNRWAALVVERLNERYGWPGVSAQLNLQIQMAWKAYQEAQAAYLQTLSENQTAVLQAQLERVKDDLACAMRQASQLTHWQEDLAAFVAHLEGLPQEERLTPGDVLALATLQQRILAPQICAVEVAPAQMQWTAEALTGWTPQQAKEVIQELTRVLQQRSQSLQKRQSTLADEIVQVQQKLEEEQRRLEEARLQRDTTWQTYQALTALQTQAQVLGSSENQVAYLAAEAAIPAKPIAPHTPLNVALAAVLGVIGGTLFVLMREWLRSSKEYSHA